MIARIWHGKTSLAHYEIYTEFLKKKAIPDYQETPGFVNLMFLRNIVNGEGHFTLITVWKELEAIKNFAGDDVDKAKYYDEDREFLLEFEESVQHFEVFAGSC
jgi:heme-degrading monooxygenase HmoA